MSEIERFTRHDSGDMLRSKDGGWVRYQDHRARVERLTSDLRDRNEVRIELNAAQIEATRLRTALTEAHERCRALELSVEQADEMKAHAEASAAAEEAETDRVTAERDAAQAEVDRLTQELDGRRATNQRVIAERDAARAEVARLKDHLFPWATYKQLKDAKEHVKEHVAKLTAERDAAQVEVERLRTTLAWADATIYRLQAERDQTATIPKGREVGRFGLDGHYLDAMEPTRPSDEDIWREAFITMLPSYPWEKAAKQSDGVLVEYRKRWPR